jgi:hypothetical protein
MPGSREDGKIRSSRTLPPYRFTGKKILCLKYNAGKSGKREGTFFHSFTTNSAWRGTRLGLSMAYDIIKAHGWKSLYLQQKV